MVMDDVFSWINKSSWTQMLAYDGLLIDLLFIEINSDMYKCAHLLHDDGIIPAKVDDIIK
jgi:hypothetical protein